MVERAEKVAGFRALHAQGCFVMPNVWEPGLAHLMAGLGFEALGTTSSGHAHAEGLRDRSGDIGLDAALAHAARIAGATDLPVSADLENGYADAPEAVAEAVIRTAGAGLAGVSIEDLRPDPSDPVYGRDAAIARIEAAVRAAREADILLTARADGMLIRAYGFEEALARVEAFAALGADVVFVPGLPGLVKLEALCAAVGAPVNHLVGAGARGASLAEIAKAGARRVSVGGNLARVAFSAVLDAGRAMAKGDFGAAETGAPWAEILETMEAGRGP